MEIKLNKLETENQNTASLEIDTLSTKEIVKVINDNDATVALAVQSQLPAIAALVDVIVDRLKKGGRLFYIGAGTSGRLGFMDAAECPPTYGVSFETVQGIMAGGFNALYKAKEGAEDDSELGVNDCKEHNLSDKDVLVGLAASGRTPYVLGALEYANSIGCATGSVACVSNSEIGKVAKYKIETVTGPEVVTGSTRMKAGTAQKMVLNMITTSTFIKMGKVYNNLMVDVMPTNQKLVARSKSIICKATGCSKEEAEQLYIDSNKNLKAAIFMYKTGATLQQALDSINQAEGHLKTALNNFSK